MPVHRRELGAYGHPLPPIRVRLAGVRRPKVPGVLARARMAQPPEPPGLPRPPTPTPPIPRGRRRAPLYETGDPREILALVQNYARGRRTIVLSYAKATENDRLITREIEPYSIRLRVTRRRGRARYLYGFCLQHQGIHSFLVQNIRSVRGTNRSYMPRWRVEF